MQKLIQKELVHQFKYYYIGFFGVMQRIIQLLNVVFRFHFFEKMMFLKYYQHYFSKKMGQSFEKFNL